MICLHCGKPIPPGRRFCPGCGAPVPDAAQAAPPAGMPPVPPSVPMQPPASMQPSGSGKKRTVAGPIVVAAVAILAGVLFFLLGGQNWTSSLNWLPMLVLCGVFALFFAIDLLGHRLLHIVRSAGHWCVLALVTAGLVCAGAGTVSTLTVSEESRTNLDFAYRYLLDGDGAAALQKAALCPEEDSEIITLLADAVKRDYVSTYFEANRLLKEAALKPETETRVREIRSLAAGALGLSISEDTGELVTGGENLPLVGITQEASAPTMTEAERGARVEQLVYEICDEQGAADVMDSRTDELYKLDKALTQEDLSALDSATIQQLLLQYPGDEDVLLVAVKYYTRMGDYTQAREYARQLLDVNSSESNLVVYTDLIAQQVKDGQSSTDPATDPEARSLLQQAEQKELEASQLNTQLPSELEKYDQLITEAQDLRDQAANLDITRAINYLISKKSLTGDDSGMIDLQIAKLYLAADERDQAKEYIWKVVDNCGILREDSPIREPLQEVVDAYNKLEAAESDPSLTAAVQRLVSAQSQNVVGAVQGQNSINGTMANFVTSTLKYDRLSVLIGKIDTENYPTVRAYVNISGEKDNTFGAAGDFSESDFELFDTQYQIKDFKLIKDQESEKVSIALVMDCSGSMEGSPIEEARLAAEACADNMDTTTQRMALIPYESGSSVAVPLTNSSSTLISGIRSLRSGGGTYISGAIRTALGELQGAGGTRAIILLTDGQDGGTAEEMAEALLEAKAQGVAIFTVGLGDVNESYLRNIAQSTGGKFIAAESSTELSDIYLLLQRYIVNNYCFEYTVTENPETDPRSLTVAVPAYAADDVKAYRISGEEVTQVDEDTGIYPVSEDHLAVYAVTPGSASQGDLQNGVPVTVRGSGFQDGMTVSIGGIALTNVKVKDAGELTGTLKGGLTAGGYDVRAQLPDNRVDTLYSGFRVFRAGTVTSVQMGNVLIMADNIGVTGESGSRTELTASGNVSINGFLYSTGELTITPDNQLADENLSAVGQEALYLGASGSVEGSGKLYASYAQAVAAAENGNTLQQMVGHTFTENLFGGKDLVVRTGAFSMSVGESDTEFGTGGYTQAISDELRDYSIKFPGFTEIGAAKVTLYTDRLQLDAEALDFGDIEDNLISALTGGVKATKKDRDAMEKSFEGKLGDWSKFPITGSLSVALGATDVRFGGEVQLKLPDKKTFFMFPVKALGVKINSLDPDYEYWSANTSILLPGVKNILGNAQKENSIEIKIASYFWYPDSLEVAVSMDPGIPLFKVFNLTKVGGGLSGVSGLFIGDETITKKDVVLKVLAEADINIFKILGWKETGASRSITRWGELGKISDAEVAVNFSDLSLDISADLELLQQKMANAEIGISTKKFLVKAGVGTELSCAGIDIGGDLDVEVSVTWAGQNQDGVSTLIDLSGKGHLRCSWADVNWDNKTVGLELTGDIATSDGTILAVKVYCNDDWVRAWYDSRGMMLWDRFHFESTF